MGDSEEALERLKHEYPEIDESVLQGTLRNNGYDLRRASDALRVRAVREELDHGRLQYDAVFSVYAGPILFRRRGNPAGAAVLEQCSGTIQCNEHRAFRARGRVGLDAGEKNVNPSLCVSF